MTMELKEQFVDVSEAVSVKDEEMTTLTSATTLTQQLVPSTSDSTPILLLEQLIYVENTFGNSVLSSEGVFDEDFQNDLSIFADDSFIIPDEVKKPKEDDNVGSSSNLFEQFNNLQPQETNVVSPLSITRKDDSPDTNLVSESLAALLSSQISTKTNPVINTVATSLLAQLPKCDVPMGAKVSLKQAGVTDIQIDALAALIYQQQQKFNKPMDANLMEDEFMSFYGRINNTTDLNNLFLRPLETPVQRQDPVFNHERSLSAVSTQSLESDVSTMTYSGENTNDYKKRRITQASARFRMKKKMKEREMETTLRDLSDNMDKMSARIKELELENKILKNLIIKGDDDV